MCQKTNLSTCNNRTLGSLFALINFQSYSVAKKNYFEQSLTDIANMFVGAPTFLYLCFHISVFDLQYFCIHVL